MTNHKSIIDEGEAVLFDSSDNSHDLEWETKIPYLGTSTIVKNPATHYAKRIASRLPEVRPREDGFWSFLGNNLAQAALSPITPFREIKIVVNKTVAGKTLQRIGHADGVTFRGSDGFATLPHKADHATLEECKAFATCGDEAANEVAYRQGATYAGDIITQIAQGDSVFPLASFNKDPTAQPIAKWPDGLPIAAVVCRILPRFGPGSITETDRPIQPFDLTPESIAQFTDFYDRKFSAIAPAFSEDVAPAQSWDFSPDGLAEFAKPLLQVARVDDEAVAGYTSKLSESKAAAQLAKSLKEANEPFLKTALATHGIRSENGKNVSIHVGGLVVTGRLPGYTHITIEGAAA